jgi:hypothetical protein
VLAQLQRSVPAAAEAGHLDDFSGDLQVDVGDNGSPDVDAVVQRLQYRASALAGAAGGQFKTTPELLDYSVKTGVPPLRAINTPGFKSYLDQQQRNKESIARAGRSAAQERFDTNQAFKERTEMQHQEDRMHDRFVQSAEYKNVIPVTSAVENVRSLMGKKRYGPQDMAIIYAVVKALDPTSVVREGEFAAALRTRGLGDSWDYIKGRVEGKMLTETQAQQFLEVLEDVHGKYLNRLRGFYRAENARAKKRGLDPSMVTGDAENYLQSIPGFVPGEMAESRRGNGESKGRSPNGAGIDSAAFLKALEEEPD